MAKVIKRNDKKAAFDPEALRKAISKAFEEGGLSLEDSKEKIDSLVDMVSTVAEEKGEIHAERIREMVLSELDDIEPKASEAWRKYDKEHKNRE